MLFNTLLTLHIIAGFTALITAFVAILSKTMHAAHQWHVYSGHLYFWGMAVVFLTALPMSILHPNLFLFLIAIFSFSLALTGWRFAKNRRGAPQPLDWVQAAVMAVTSMVMILYGLYLLLSYNSNGISILVFGCIGAVMSGNNLRTWRAGTVRGQARLAAHLNHMLAATIATLTAFIVTNITVEPKFVLWLAPTVLMTPLIVWWNKQLQKGRQVIGASLDLGGETRIGVIQDTVLALIGAMVLFPMVVWAGDLSIIIEGLRSAEGEVRVGVFHR